MAEEAERETEEQKPQKETEDESGSEDSESSGEAAEAEADLEDDDDEDSHGDEDGIFLVNHDQQRHRFRALLPEPEEEPGGDSEAGADFEAYKAETEPVGPAELGEMPPEPPGAVLLLLLKAVFVPVGMMLGCLGILLFRLVNPILWIIRRLLTHPKSQLRRTWHKHVQPSLLWGTFFDALYYAVFHLSCALGRVLGPRRVEPGKPIVVMRMVSNVYHGGLAKVVVQTMLAMPKDGVYTNLVVFGKKIVPPELEDLDHIRLLKRRMTLFLPARRLHLFHQVCRLARIIYKCKPHIIHVHEPQFTPLVRIAAGLNLRRIPIVAHLHSVYQTRRDSYSALQSRIERDVLREARLIACSETIRFGAHEWLERARHPVTLIEDGADDYPAWPKDDDLLSDLRRAANGRKIVAMMARLTPLKRIGDFLLGCRALLDEGYPAYIVLISYGTKRDRVEWRKKFRRRFAPEEGEFLFQVEGPQHLIQAFDVGVSTSKLEGLGLTILEFQMQGVPVVATEIPAHREMIEEGRTGLLFYPRDAFGLYRQLKRLFDDEQLRADLGEAGRLAASRRKWTDTAAQTVAFYRQVLEEEGALDRGRAVQQVASGSASGL